MRRPFLCTFLAAAALAPVAQVNAQSAAARNDLFVTAATLKSHLADPNLVLFHVSSPPSYAKAHIPGARLVGMQDVSIPMDRNAPASKDLSMLSADSMRTALQKLGVSNNSRIVIYFDEEWISPTTRIILALNYAGLGTHVVMLEGGLPAWIAAGGATSTDTAAVKPGTLSPLTLQPLIVTAEWVRDNAKKPGYALIDGRTAGFYDGTMNGGTREKPVKGHIPGAHSVPFTDVWDKGMLLPADSLQKLFAKAGVKPGDTIVGYCHIGQQATAMLFAARSLGYKTVLFDGSFNEWAERGWPVEVAKQ